MRTRSFWKKENEIVPVHPCFGSETTNLTHKNGMSPLTNWEIMHFQKTNYNQAMRTRAFSKKRKWNSTRPPLSRIRDNKFNAQNWSESLNELRNKAFSKKQITTKQWGQEHFQKKENEIVPVHPCLGSETTHLTYNSRGKLTGFSDIHEALPA